jgi:glyoxylase-like metal-dependent hydrolase (beta-lactamase superfamily II)
MESLKLGDLTLTWLQGGNNHLDGGAMFGVVPKPLWSKKYPSNEKNQIELRTDPILVQKGSINLLIESGLGKGKLNEKQLRNFGVTEESLVDESLAQLGLKRQDIHYVLMTHLHFDHASGLTMWEGEQLVPSFPKAKHIVSQIEWDEMRQPNIRSKNTYWKENWEAIVDLVQPFEQECQVLDELTMIHTGGHSAGHSIIRIDSQGEKALHFADIMPTHAHQNPLWVMAYDDYPMDSVFAKEKWVKRVLEEEYWVVFYHDSQYRAIKWNKDGKVIDSIKREVNS